jgi:5'-methylthioadenosine phosphorylase
VEQIIAVLNQNSDNACKVVRYAVAAMPRERGCKCGEALRFAIMTQRNLIPKEARERLGLIIGKYMESEATAKA